MGQRRGGTSSRGDEGKTKKKGEEGEGEGAGGEVLLVRRTPQRSELRDAERRKCRAANSRQECVRACARTRPRCWCDSCAAQRPSSAGVRSLFLPEFEFRGRPTASRRRGGKEVDSSPGFGTAPHSGAQRTAAQRSAAQRSGLGPGFPAPGLSSSGGEVFLDLPCSFCLPEDVNNAQPGLSPLHLERLAPTRAPPRLDFQI